MKKITFLGACLLLFILLSFQILKAQNVGDFRSKNTGNWNTPGTWEVCTQVTPSVIWTSVTSGYPGVATLPAGTTTSTVTIVGCHEITVDVGKNNSFTYNNIGKLVVNGRMVLLKQNDVHFGNTLQEVLIDGGSIFWSDNPTNLYLPQNCLITLINLTSAACSFPKGLQPIANCTGSQNLYIGGTKPYSSCNGGNNTMGSFEQVNNAGGTNFAALPLTNPSAVCLKDNKEIQFYGSIIKYILGSVGTLTYRWDLVSPPPMSGYTFSSTTAQNVNIGTLTFPGDYKFKLTVNSTLLAVTSSREFVISVDRSTSYNGVTWSDGVPSEGNHRHAIINADYNTSQQGSFDACSCTVNAGKKLTITEGNSVKVVDFIRNLGNTDNVIIESDGNLIQIIDGAINAGNITVQRNIKVGAARNQYNYLGAPVAFAGGGTFKDIYPGAATSVLYHNETNNKFYNSTGVNIPGRGLALKEPPGSDGAKTITANYKGVPQNGTITLPITNSNTAETALGYNLIGNPYPSNIDLQKLYDINGGKTSAPQTTSPNISPTFYFWDNNANDIFVQEGNNYKGEAYAIYNALTGNNGTGTYAAGSLAGNIKGIKKPTNIVKVGQGFMTRSLISNYNFKFNNSIRTSEAASVDFLGKGGSATQDDRYWLQMTSPSGVTSTAAVVHYAAGNNLFGPEDSRTMGGSDALYTLVEGERIAIDGRSRFENTAVVPLGTQHFVSGSYTIGIDEAEGIFGNGQTIYLKDRQTGTITNLSQGTYTFSANAGESTGRFEIIYKPETVLVTYSTLKEELVVYREAEDFIIKAQTRKISDVEVYDAAGRMVYKTKPDNTKAVISSQYLMRGVYILKISQGNEVTVKKVIR
ncbi:T9SS type A sorting domain-containing protein [Chryseobacterium salivictor]|uniref:Secretion system C-terminal sorting domain-containing protein n=1 Tax=Chryseobacterium salivictor TaxID=2547600 RepID=A0A4P6ZCK1_9FLAO|nr:T9SS type A sorting domain-containing protein [Chryseobacterium salivictor]QBO57218.1 hypothetical protein NBC122_00369 [Chryseobacterium salivictor]